MENLNIYIPWDGWKPVRSLGRGSFGEVYEIERQTAGKTDKAALKIISIRADMIYDVYGSKYDENTARRLCEERLRSITNEYNIMRELRGNPYVVRCDGMKVVGHRDGIGCDVYIMMELLTPLQEIWKRRDVTEDDAVRLGEDICRALMALEQHHIIHRDIKPQNILVTDSGTHKLGDFGTARSFEHTTSATMAGTETYMAPEVVFRKKYGRDVDTYSLGLVIYRMLNNGQLPFLKPDVIPTADERERSLQRRLQGEPLPAPAAGSAPLKAVVLKACSYDRKNRYSSAKAMLDDLIMASEGTMPMFSRDDDKSTVVEDTGTGTKGGTKGRKQAVQNKTAGDQKKKRNDNGGDGGFLSGSRKKIAAIIIGIFVVIAGLAASGVFTPKPEPEPYTPPQPDTEQGTDQDEEQETETEEPVNTEGINTENFLTEFRNGNYSEAESWGSKNPEYVTEGVVMNMPSDISSAYISVIKQYGTDADGFIGMYGYTDIDEDGTAELIIFTPGPESDTKIKIFTYANGSVTELGEINGSHSSVYAYPGHNGMVVGWGHMGSEAFSVVSIEDGQIRTDDYGSRDISEGEDYIYPGNLIHLNDCETY